MTLGHKVKNGKTTYHFDLTQDEFVALTNGKKINHVSANKDYEQTKFTLSFKGKVRKNE